MQMISCFLAIFPVYIQTFLCFDIPIAKCVDDLFKEPTSHEFLNIPLFLCLHVWPNGINSLLTETFQQTCTNTYRLQRSAQFTDFRMHFKTYKNNSPEIFVRLTHDIGTWKITDNLFPGQGIGFPYTKQYTPFNVATWTRVMSNISMEHLLRTVHTHTRYFGTHKVPIYQCFDLYRQ